jgi:small-conductance mechanosensitive channel
VEKKEISEQWTNDEREQVKKLIEEKILKIKNDLEITNETLARTKIKQHITFMEENIKKMNNKLEDLEGLLERLDEPSEFLQQNRINYKEFINE